MINDAVLRALAEADLELDTILDEEVRAARAIDFAFQAVAKRQQDAAESALETAFGRSPSEDALELAMQRVCDGIYDRMGLDTQYAVCRETIAEIELAR